MKYLEHTPNSVAIVGMGPSIIDMFNEVLTQEFTLGFADEVWAINMAANLVRHDVVFWMDDLDAQERFRPGLMAALRHFRTPVITTKAYPEIVPLSYDYPIQEVGLLAIKTFGKPYLNNGIAMALAYAIWKGVKRIKLYGADFSYPNRDYAESGRACTEAWITYGLQRNCEIMLCPKTSLFDAVLDKGIYGYRAQPSIRLDDGTDWQFQPLDVTGPKQPSAGAGDPVYVPEDSSGIKPNGQDVTSAVAAKPRARKSKPVQETRP